ncbi:MAG TPA: hypothetical protein VH542_06370 [Steroidobacteraceae bacterium]|jgi:hypothetical protein
MGYRVLILDEVFPWRRALGRQIAWLLALKAVALLILWLLFFSAAQHAPVTPSSSAQHLAVDPQGAPR